jgi:hypothetical protein
MVKINTRSCHLSSTYSPRLSQHTRNRPSHSITKPFAGNWQEALSKIFETILNIENDASLSEKPVGYLKHLLAAGVTRSPIKDRLVNDWRMKCYCMRVIQHRLTSAHKFKRTEMANNMVAELTRHSASNFHFRLRRDESSVSPATLSCIT